MAKYLRTHRCRDHDGLVFIDLRVDFFLEALKYETLPHLGLAFELDHTLMILAETDNIPDAIAFPKTQKASDVRLQTPSFYTKEKLTALKNYSAKTQGCYLESVNYLNHLYLRS